MPRRLIRVFWPLALLLLVFGFRTMGCKGMSKSAKAKKRWPTELTVRWTVPPPLPTYTIPPGVHVIPNPPE